MKENDMETQEKKTTPNNRAKRVWILAICILVLAITAFFFPKKNGSMTDSAFGAEDNRTAKCLGFEVAKVKTEEVCGGDVCWNGQVTYFNCYGIPLSK